MEAYGTELISAVTLIIVAWIEFCGVRDRKRTEKRSERRAKEQYLAMKMVNAGLKLNLETAKAVESGRSNGAMHAAKAEAEAAMQEYQDFIRQLAAVSSTKV